MRRVVAYILTAVLGLSWVFLVGESRQGVVAAQSSAPELRKIGPETISAGAPTFTIRLDGRNFVSGAKVLFDATPLDSSRVTSKGKVLLAEIDSELVQQPGTHTIQAMNPDNQVSAILTLTVVQQSADLNIRLEGNAVQEDSGLTFQIDITGGEFDEDSRAFIYGARATTEFISEERLRILIPSKFTNDPARVPISVRNPGGELSNVEIFFVVPKPADIVSIEPDSIEVGSADFKIEVRGEFKPGATIIIDGTPLATTQPKEARLEAIVPASFRSSPRQLIVRVEQEGIQSADFVLVVTPTTGPFIFTISPSRLRQSEDKETIDIVGANFSGEAKVLIDGQEAKVKSATRRRLTVSVSEELLAGVGSHTIQVVDKDGLTSNQVSFQVAPDVTVSTLAGGKRDGFNTEACVSAEDALFRRPSRLDLAPDGLLYVTDHQNHAIRTINVDTGEVCTLAGTGAPGYNDTGNPAGFQPTFSFPLGVAVDSDGTVYVTENGNDVVRRIRRAAGGAVTVETFAGANDDISDKSKQKSLNSTLRGLDGFRDGEADEANFRQPDDIVIASDGAIYVSDPGNHSIRRIRRIGGRVVVETIAGNGVPGFADGISVNARFDTPTGIVLSDDEAFLFVADTNNARIRRITLATGRVETVAGSGRNGSNDGPAGEATFDQPIGLALDADGVLYVSEFRGNRIRRVDPSGDVSTIAGGDPKFRDGPGIKAAFNHPRGIALDRQRGILYVADFENSAIRQIALR